MAPIDRAAVDVSRLDAEQSGSGFFKRTFTRLAGARKRTERKWWTLGFCCVVLFRLLCVDAVRR
ncbi:hypothetical protein ACNKHU_21965 [Shigella flexneri]